MKKEDLKFREYTITSPFGTTSFTVSNAEFLEIENNPKETYSSKGFGFSYSYSDLKNINGETIKDDGEEFIYGKPLSLTNQDIIKMIEFETYSKLTMALKRDTFVNIKNVPNIKIDNPHDFIIKIKE